MKGYYIILLLLIVLACQQREDQSYDYYAHIESAKVKEVLKKAIDWSGGIERWSLLDSLKYTKHSKLFFSDNKIESESIQRHLYKMRPEFSAYIHWNGGDSSFHEINYASDATKWLNGEIVDRGVAVAESVMSSLYVLGMPYKLLDKGVQLDFVGSVEIQGVQADAIRAEYNPDANDNHSTSDLWWYYFNSETGEFLGCLVYHPPTYAYIENQAFHDVNGLKFHAHRKSYRSDSLRNIEFLRAEFWYSDYSSSSARE